MNSIQNLPTMNFISIDLETTGVEAQKDKIIEFGAVKFALINNARDLKILEEKSFLIHPGITLPQIITHITGITDEDLQGAPKIEEKAQEIKDFIGDLPIIGHNIQFDTGFLKANGILPEISNPELDTFELSTILMPGLPSYSLEIISKILKLQHLEKHRALDDAIAAMELFAKLAQKFTHLPEELVEKIKSLCQKTDWEGKILFSTLENEKATQETETQSFQEPSYKILSLTDDQKILLENTNRLYQTPAPYAELARNLTKAAEKDTYIAVPYKLFREIEQTLPDSLAKIDKPQNYISPKKLNDFTEKSQFTKSEFAALMKYLIWSKQTKTGLLSELKILPEEKSTINKINIDPDKTENEYFYEKALEKDTDSPALCTHDWLISAPNSSYTIKNLILIDFESFTKSVSFENSTYLKLEILLEQLNTLPQTAEIEALKAKSTILFGLMGMLHQKYHDNNAYIARAFINEEISSTKEFSDIKQAIKNLFELSQALGNLNTEENHTALQNWKKSLTGLHGIFIEPKLNDELVWLEIDYKQDLTLRKVPYELAPEIAKVLSRAESYKIVSENLDLNDNCAFTKRLFGLNEDIALHEEKRTTKLTINIAQDAPDEDHKKEMVKIFQKILQGKTAILFSSQKQLEYFTLELKKELKDTNLKLASQFTGSIGKITEQFKVDPTNSILLLNSYFWLNLASEIYENIEQFIIYRLPFDPPSDPFVMTNSLKFSDPFNEFQIPLINFSLRSLINRLKPIAKEVLILDSRLTTKSYGKQIIENLKSLGKTQVINIKNYK